MEVTVRIFSGTVALGDECRVSDGYYGPDGAVHIGGQDVVEVINETTWQRPVTVAIADERFTGDLATELGWGYSEYTPMDPDVLKVGEHDLLEILRRYEGQEITVWVADGPINVLEVEA